MLLLSRLLIATLIILYSQTSYCSELISSSKPTSRNKPNSHNEQDRPSLDLGSVLNDKGQPITVPSETQSHFNYSAPAIAASSPANAKNSKTNKTKTKKAKPQSRKQQLASRSKVANDPGCRWLNGRMNSLERNLSSGVNSRNRHYQQELSVRQGEWECMKCGAEGPDQSDHGNCQHKR
ncbi:hypothetical protein ACVBIO_03775 [Shewanella sp. 0m-8]